MTVAARVRRTTGIVIGDGRGGAVSAATCAGERIWRAPIHPTSVIATSKARARTVMRVDRAAIDDQLLGLGRGRPVAAQVTPFGMPGSSRPASAGRLLSQPPSSWF
jgi:hypothetical protein